MDAEQLKAILEQFQLSNQQFLERMLADNESKMKAVLQVNNHVVSIPKFREFNRVEDRWSTYNLQLEQHFEANNVTDESTKRACLLSWIGSESLELLQKLVTGKINEKSFTELTTLLAKHFQSKQHILAARFKFFKTTMKSGQSYADWVAELRGIARDCDFQCKKDGCEESSVDYHIRDMIVIHTPHDNVRSTALQKTNPKLEEVLQIATLYEETRQSCNEIKGESSSSSVNSINFKNHHQNDHRSRSRSRKPSRHRSSSKPTQKSCPGCGSSHQRADCYHYKQKSVCDTCSKIGHISAVCNSRSSSTTHRSRGRSSNQSRSRQEAVNQCRDQQFHQISAVDVINAEVTEVQQSAILPSNCDKIGVDIIVNDQVMNFQVDTGATCTLVGQFGYEQLNKPACEPVNKIVKAYGGHQIPIRGVAKVHVKWHDMNISLPLLVVNSREATNILGLDWFKALKFQINIPNFHISKNLCNLVSGPTSSQVNLQAAINKFVPNFSTKAGPLNDVLTHQGAEFKWTNRQQKAFQDLIDTIINAVQLVHYQSDMPIRLATDASKYGIGAVISHVYPNGSERPISFASKTLTETQIGYSQIEKEALSIIYGVTKFHQYLYGRKFELVTDHQALTTLFNPNKKLPVMTLHRLQRWAIVLLSYNYTIRYNSTKHHANADALSRLPVGADPEFDREEANMCNVYEVYQSIIDDCPVNAKSVALFTKDDTILKEVGHMISNGWPASLKHSNIQDDLKPYFDRRFSLSFQNGIILLHSDYTRVVIPVALRSQVLQMLHEGHWGKSRMKQMARRYVWFPKIDEAIEKVSASCSICSSKASDPKKQFSSWPQATEPWERIHLDFAGPFYNRMWLIVVDSFSKFPYTIELQSATSATTISSLQKILSIEGLPRTIVSDNGTQFTSAEFQKFCELNSIDHLTIAPFHPASNGLAERFVRTFKESFSKLMMESSDKDLALFKYLSTYRTTPDPVSSKSPAELLHGRQPRNILSVLMPPKQHSKAVDLTKFHVGQEVHARNYSRNGKWIDGIIQKIIGRRMYVIQSSKGIMRRHQNQLRQRGEMIPREKDSSSDDIEIQIDNRSSASPPPQQSINDAEQSPPRTQPPAMTSILKRTPENPPTTPENPSTTQPDQSITKTPHRRTQRIRRKLVRFSPE